MRSRMHAARGSRSGIRSATFVLLLLLQSAAPLHADVLTDLFTSINERLSYMQAVAEYKAQQALPVEDLERESSVLQDSKSAATTAGLEAESATAFFQAQIDLAKIIQYRHHASLSSNPQSGAVPDLNNTIRPALDLLGTRIIQLLAQRIHSEGVFHSSDWLLFSDSIHEPYLTEADKRLLFDSLLLVRAR